MSPGARISAAARAGGWYFLILFLAGFVLGTVRVMVIVPVTGTVFAVLLELPVMLLLSWWVSARLIDRFGIPQRAGPRLVMGGVAFALLMTAELGLSVSLFGREPLAHLAHYTTLAGAAGLCAQILFALIPYLQGRRATR